VGIRNYRRYAIFVFEKIRFPRKEDLDQVFHGIPIWYHFIFRPFAVMNSKRVEMSKVTSALVDPPVGNQFEIKGLRRGQKEC